MARGLRRRGGDDEDLLRGGRLDDTLLGGFGADLLIGRGGRDRLIGGGGLDRLFGGGADDTLKGGAGRDRLSGGAGEDSLFGGGGDDRLRGDRGDDRIVGGGGRDLAFGGAGDDRLLGGGGLDTLRSGAGRDDLRGGGGKDRLDGGGGSDRLFGGQGNDTLIGGKGSDTLVGGGGADTFHFRSADGAATDVIRDFTRGVDHISLSGFSAVEHFGDLAISNEAAGAVVDLGAGRRIVLEGVNANALTGADFGLAPAPAQEPTPVTEPTVIDGGQNADTLVGGAVSQHLRGFGGDDVLITSGGVDTLTGGAGADMFLIRLEDGAIGASPDIVSDFQYALGDVIGLSEALAGLLYVTIDEVVRAVPESGGTMISINRGGGFVDALFLQGVAFTTEQLSAYGFDAPAMGSGGIVDNPNGFQNSSTTSADPEITPDGRFVAFVDKQSLDGNPDDQASVVVEGDPPILSGIEGTLDVFVRNMATGAVVRASGDGAGGVLRDANGDRLDAMSPAMSDDGRIVAFVAAPNSIAAGATVGNVYVRNLFTGEAPVLVSVTQDGDPAGGVPVGSRTFTTSSGAIALSADGGVIAFVTNTNGLSSARDSNNGLDVYVRDLKSGETTLVSAFDLPGSLRDGRAGGGVMNPQLPFSSGDAPRPTGDAVAISADGRYVAFVSGTGLVFGDSDGDNDVYLRDLATGDLILVSDGVTGEVTSVDISADGSRVVFSTLAPPATGEIFDQQDVHLATLDLAVGSVASVERVSVDRGGVDFEDARSEGITISPDGERVAFLSSAGGSGGDVAYVLDLDDDALFYAQAAYDGFPNTALSLSNDRLALRVDANAFADTIAVVDLTPVPGDGILF